MNCGPSKGPGGVVQVNGCIATLSLCVGGRRGGGGRRREGVEGGLSGGCGGRAERQESLASRASDGSYLWYVCVSGVCI